MALKPNGRVILLIDDEPMVLRTYSQIMERHTGVAVHTEPTVHDGWDYLRTGNASKVALAITDTHAGNIMNGVEFFRQAEEAFPEVQCYVVSGGYDQRLADEIKFLEKRGRFLTKPVSSIQLLEILGRHGLIAAVVA